MLARWEVGYDLEEKALKSKIESRRFISSGTLLL